MAAVVAAVMLAAACGPGRDVADRPPPAPEPPSAQLFPPDELAALEAPDRAEWQQPERVMDALRIADGSRVADIGAGGGWFTSYLSRRVGPNGLVYAEDVQPAMIESIRRRIDSERLTNVRSILGTADDPGLPPDLDAVLMVDTYPQIANRVALLQRIHDALAPGGRLGIVDFRADGEGGPGPELSQRVAPEVVIADARAAGFTDYAEEGFLRYQYMLIFTKRATSAARGGR